MAAEILVLAPAGSAGDRLRELAHELGLPFASTPAGQPILLLGETAGKLGLRLTDRPAARPILVDFSEPDTLRRVRGAASQPLARAIGRQAATIVDATAGLGRDSAVLGALGAAVTMVENHAVLWALLRDGLARAATDPGVAALAARLQLVHADARVWLRDLAPAQRPEVVYLDPMYPERKKAALAKLEMQVLQSLLADDSHPESLFAAAKLAARRRVVVKRPLRAAPIAAGVHHSVVTKLVRFDVYETKA